MTKRSSKKDKKKDKTTSSSQTDAWLPSRTGLIVLTVVTILLAAWVTVQGLETNGFFESVLWGLGFAGSIWVVFGVVFLVNKFLRGR